MSYTLTADGRARIVAAQNKRWKAYRREKRAEALVEKAGNKIVHPKKKAAKKSTNKKKAR